MTLCTAAGPAGARLLLLLLMAAGTASAQAPASFAQRIYLANDDHTDFMWSADDHTYRRVFVEQLDFNLKLIDDTAGEPLPYRARYNTDGSYWLWAYERARPTADFDRLMARVKDGSINVPMNTLVLTYGAQPLEAVLRGLYYAGRLERRYDHRFKIANATENQTLPLGLTSLFAGAGAPYTFRGVCSCASHIPNPVLARRPDEVYWAEGPDGQRQLMKWYSVGPFGMGTYTEAGEVEKAFDWVQTDPGFLSRHVDAASGKPYSVVGLFGYGGDDLARKTGVAPPPELAAVPSLQKVPSSPYTEHFHVLARRWSNAQRQVVSSNQLDYFGDLERSHAAALPTRSVTFGNEWDLYTASMSETSARVKRSVEKLRAAELLATLVSLKYPRFMQNHTTARDDAFTDLGLFYEHNWTADGPVTRGQRAAWQDKLAANVAYYVDSIHAEGLVRLGGMIPRPESTAADGKKQRPNRFFVLNPLGWPRSTFADHLHSGSTDVHVVDLASGREVLHQMVQQGGTQHLRIHAPDVPSTGYKVFEVRPGPGAGTTAAAAAAASVGAPAADGSRVFQNAAVRLVVAKDGAITSFVDKRRGNTELAATIDGLALNDLAADSSEGDALLVENAGPVSVTLRARSDAGLPHTSAITLYADSDRVDIRNTIDTNFGDVRHWGFSFALPQPAVHSEEVGAINLNKRQAEGGHYADTAHARVDYFTLNHFATITAGDGGRGVALSNAELSFAQLGRSTPAVLDTQTPQIKVLAGGQVDGPSLGIPRQNGASAFLQRFALQATAGHDPVAAMRFALEHQNPLVAAPVIGGPSGSFPADRYSLLSVGGDAGALLWAVKPAEDGIGHGLTIRLWNVANAPARATVALHGGLQAARRTTHVETDQAAVALDDSGRMPASLARQQVQTYRLVPTP